MGTFTASFDLGMLVGFTASARRPQSAGTARRSTSPRRRRSRVRPLAVDVPHRRGTAPRPRVASAMAETASAIDHKLVNRLTEEQMARFREHTGTSAAYYERARKVMPAGSRPRSRRTILAVYIERGEGALVWDVDGSEYVDFHNGFGVMCIGRKPDRQCRGQGPESTRAALRRAHRGLDRRRRTPAASASPPWRFTNSGTESTMDAVHLARGITGRDHILKIEGSYGHHDAVMVSVYPDLEDLGTATTRSASPTGRLPQGAHRADPLGSVQRRGRPGESPAQAPGPGRRADHGAGDDEHQHHPAAAGLPGAGPRAHHRARRAADLRRGEDRVHDLAGQGDAALRRHPGHDHAGQGDLRRLPGWGDRDDRGARRQGRRRVRSTSTGPSTATLS